MLHMKEFLKKEFSDENIIFWKKCEDYRSLSNESQVKCRCMLPRVEHRVHWVKTRTKVVI